MSLSPTVTTFVPGFLDEAAARLDAVLQELNALTEQTDPDEAERRISTIVRALHTIKGSASCLLLDDVAAEAHHAESIIEPFRTEQALPDAEVLAHLRTSIERMQAACAERRNASRAAHAQSVVTRSLADVLRQHAELMRLRADERDGEICFRLRAPHGVLLNRQECSALRSILIHTLNNCVDHAMQLPEIRRAAGKPSALTVTIVAEPVGPGLRLTIDDDGPGIDLGAVIGKASELGLRSPSCSPPADGPEGQAQDARLVLAPGVTTATRPTIRAGRGLGLDAATAGAADLGGSVGVSSTPGRGATITFLFPVLNLLTSSVDTGSESASAA